MSRIKGDNVQFSTSFVVPEIEETKPEANYDEVLEKKRQIVATAENEARQIIEAAKNQAQAQATQIVESARNDALAQVDEIKTQAHNEGFEAGHQEGINKAIQDMTDKVRAVDTFAESNFKVKENIIKSAELDIIRLVSEISKKVCGHAFEIDDNILQNVTETAIKSLKDKESITIIINPELAEKIYSISDGMKEKISQLQSIKIIEDNSVSPDGTIVESPLSRVDSRVSAQINEITEKLMQGLRDV